MPGAGSGTSGGYLQNPAADPDWPGSARRGEEGERTSRAAAVAPQRARALAGWDWGWKRNSEAGARTGPGRGVGGWFGAGSGGGGRPWRRICLSRGRSLGPGDREGGRDGEEGCGSAEAAATGTRRHHLCLHGRRSLGLRGPSPLSLLRERSRRRDCSPACRTSG